MYDAFQRYEAEGWERIAAAYDDFFDSVSKRLAPDLLDAARVGEGSRVLDVGSGPGYVALAAVERGASVVATDFAAAMVALAQSRGLAAVQADAENVPFDDGSFDAVTGNLLIPHLARPDEAVTQMARVLASDGWLVLSTWAGPPVSRLMGVFVDAVKNAGAEPPRDFPAGPDVFRFADGDEFAALLTRAGLGKVRTRTIHWEHPHGGPGAVWDAILAGTVRTGALVSAQSVRVQARIRREYDELMSPYPTSIPCAVVLAVGCMSR